MAWAAGSEVAICRDVRKRLRANGSPGALVRNESYTMPQHSYILSAGVCVDASVGQLKPSVVDGVVVQQLATHDKVATVEARQMRADMTQLQVAVHVTDEEPITDGGARGQVLECRVNGGLPSLYPERICVVREAGVLDEIFLADRSATTSRIEREQRTRYESLAPPQLWNDSQDLQTYPSARRTTNSFTHVPFWGSMPCPEIPGRRVLF